jgi:hypothetical protein
MGSKRMAVVAQNGKRRFHPKLNKHFVVNHEGWDVYSVDASVVRNIALPDEEFSNFVTHLEFPGLIPKGEIWLGEKNLNKEGIFFIANALVHMKAKKEGIPDEKAYTAGLNVERSLREKLTGLKFRAGRPHKRVPRELYVDRYITLFDAKFAIAVWLVDGNMVRSLYKTDYTEGGHGYVYRWVPRQEIWIEKDLDRWELPYIVSHEYLELRLMRDEGIDYDTAHEICSKVEFNLRKGRGGKSILSPGRGRLSKHDLPKLTREEIFRYVVKNYVQAKRAS